MTDAPGDSIDHGKRLIRVGPNAALSLKLCPPKPGLTLITRTRSTMSIR